MIAQSLELAASPQIRNMAIAWRKCAAADALYLFPRHLLHGLQQAHARFRLRRHGRHQSACMPCWA